MYAGNKMSTTLPLDQQLQRIYQEFAYNADFPAGFCALVARQVKDELGFAAVSGWFLLDERFLDWRERRQKYGVLSHCWNLDESGKIIDLTAAQFNNDLKRENRIREGIQVISREHPLYRRYMPRDANFGQYRVIRRQYGGIIQS